MNLLILKGFNNYFNRKIKKYADIADYISNSALSYTFSNINFDPNDGVATAQIVGSENQLEADSKTLKWEVEGTPDYVVCYESEFIHNDNEPDVEIKHIRSRWFILECVRVRDGQYKLALKRDVIADHLEQILTNPCFVEKGYVAPNDPLIFNDEGVSLNQIKNYKGEHPEVMLKDETGIPWLVLYIAKNFPASDTPGIDSGGNLPVIGNTVIDTSSSINNSDLPWYNIISTPDVTKTYRIPGAGEINISPLATLKLNQVGVGRYLLNAVRANLRYFYSSGDWTLDQNTTNEVYYDKDITTVEFGLRVYSLKRKNINISTNPNYNVRWGNDGVIVPTYWVETSGAPLYEDEWGWYDTGNIIDGVLYKGGLNPTNDPAKIAYIKTYLNGKRAWLEASTGHSAVPGQTNMEAYVGGPQSFKSASSILSYNGKLIKSGVNYYRLKITRANNYTRPIDYFTLDGSGNIIAAGTNNLAQNLAKYSDVNNSVNSNNNMVETFFEHAWFDIKYELVQTDKLRMTIDKPGVRIGLNEAAYDMLALPYGAIDYILPNDSNTADLAIATSSKEASIGIARSIASKLSSACYDMQLLPYCPYRQVAEQYAEDGYVNLGLSRPFPTGSWFGVYSITNDEDTPSRVNRKSFGLYCPSCSGTFDIAHTIELPEETSEAYKVFNACKKFRLVSPNYSSSFEFNPLKNNGVSTFNVDFNYRPFNSYIHVSPIFDGLYGVDTNDNRGLILQGDFSVGYYSDKWADYQINNANYANIFNRQIENIDFNQAQEREKQTWNNWATGITEGLGLGGGLQGAKAFSGLGPWGMLGGAIGGTVGGIVGAGVGLAKDWEWLTESQKEEKSYATDMFNYALGNVKALPYGLAKSDALTENFKFFPFIEVYDCTDKEVELFKAKLLYDGMTVGAIGALQSYIPPEDSGWDFQRLKGRLIMQDGLVDDFQVANAIYTEVNKGFYYVNQYIPPVEEDSD